MTPSPSFSRGYQDAAAGYTATPPQDACSREHVAYNAGFDAATRELIVPRAGRRIPVGADA